MLRPELQLDQLDVQRLQLPLESFLAELLPLVVCLGRTCGQAVVEDLSSILRGLVLGFFRLRRFFRAFWHRNPPSWVTPG